VEVENETEEDLQTAQAKAGISHSKNEAAAPAGIIRPRFSATRAR
jgi:hypothetical protein